MKTIFLSISCFLTLICNGQNFTSEQFPQGILHDIIGADCGAGLSFYDFNKDGWDDLSFAQVDGSPKFYINNEGFFQDTLIIEDYFIEAKSVIWADIDNDGDADLLITDKYAPSKIYENTGDLTLVDRSESSGIFQTGEYETYGASFGDFNKDGFLDLYICNNKLANTINYLYLNNGDFTFTDITESTDTGGGNKPTFQSVWIDLNDDSWLDLYVINDRASYENLFYLNDGEGGFTEIGNDLGLDLQTDAMTNSFADYDGDFDFDLFVTNSGNHNVLMNNTEGFFNNVTFDAEVNIQYLSWAGQWMDFENDMWFDLHVSTSQVGDSDGQNYAFHNNTDGTFETVNDIFPFNTTFQFCTAIGDYNNDGFVDLVGNNEFSDFASLYKNTAENGNHYLKVSLEGVLSNKDGIGSTIEVYSNGFGQKRFTFCGEDYLGQDSQRQIFGLGSNETVDSLIVTWPSGHIDFFSDLQSDQTVHILEGSSIPINLTSTTPTTFCIGDSIVLSNSSELSDLTWNTGDTSNTITVFESGWFYSSGNTALGLTILSDSIEITVNALPEIDFIAQDINCYLDSTGSISLLNLSETGMNQVSWSNDSIGDELTSLGAGIYSYIYMDTLMCSTSGSIELTELDSIAVDFTTDSISCWGLCDGELILTNITGGAQEYIVPSDLTSFCSGDHSIEIMDTLGCIQGVWFTIDTPEEIMIELNVDQITMDDLGQAEVNISGGTPPYSILWNEESGGNTFTDLEPGNYQLLVMDANFCEFDTLFEITTDIQERLKSTILVYPNPTEGDLHIKFKNQSFQYQLYSATGQIILEGNSINEHTIDTRFLPAGFYTVIIKNQWVVERRQLIIR